MRTLAISLALLAGAVPQIVTAMPVNDVSDVSVRVENPSLTEQVKGLTELFKSVRKLQTAINPPVAPLVNPPPATPPPTATNETATAMGAIVLFLLVAAAVVVTVIVGRAWWRARCRRLDAARCTRLEAEASYHSALEEWEHRPANLTHAVVLTLRRRLRGALTHWRQVDPDAQPANTVGEEDPVRQLPAWGREVEAQVEQEPPAPAPGA